MTTRQPAEGTGVHPAAGGAGPTLALHFTGGPHG
jgi:hypothetical protein